MLFNEFAVAYNAWLLGKYLEARVPLRSGDKGDVPVVPGRAVPPQAPGAPRVWNDIVL